MKIIHRISEKFDSFKASHLHKLGIKVAEGLQTFEISESEDIWNEVKALIEQWNSVDIVRTIFTAKEIENGSYLEMNPSWHHGYPQPEEDFKYLEFSYDLSTYCDECGTGSRQVEPLYMKDEPKWGKKHIMQLNWVFDVYFTLPDVYHSVFKPYGIKFMPVLKASTGDELKTVVQLVSQGISETNLDLEGYPYELCPKGCEKKYLPISRGFFPRLQSDPKLHYFLSNEYFGSARKAFRAVLISKELFGEIKRNELRGTSFAPLAK